MLWGSEKSKDLEKHLPARRSPGAPGALPDASGAAGAGTGPGYCLATPSSAEVLCFIIKPNPISVFIYFFSCRQSSESWLRGRGGYIVKILLGLESRSLPQSRVVLAINPDWDSPVSSSTRTSSHPLKPGLLSKGQLLATECFCAN